MSSSKPISFRLARRVTSVLPAVGRGISSFATNVASGAAAGWKGEPASPPAKATRGPGRPRKAKKTSRKKS